MRSIVIIVLLLAIGCNAQVDSFPRLWQNDKVLKNASIGFCVMEASTGKLVSEYNSRKALVPASTLKLLSTSAALKTLGSDYRFETKITHTGTFDKSTGIINGDLIIVGSGDPTLQSENFSSESVTDSWANILKQKGVKEIKGKIIGDAAAFERSIPGSWIWEDICNYYGAVPCGLNYADNKFKVFFNSGSTGTQAKITGSSPSYLSNTITLVSDVVARGNEDQAYAYGDPFSWNKEIRGTIPPNKTNYEIEITLPDPALLCAENFYTSLQKTGIKCRTGAAISNYVKEKSQTGTLLHSHFSPSLEKIIYFTNQKSINFYCESLVQVMGKGRRQAGLSAVLKQCHAFGIDTSEIQMEDGCGLSRANTVTPFALCALLSEVSKDKSAYKIIENSLPQAGKQGSMSSIGKGTAIEGVLKAKTGYIDRVRAYSGYVTSKKGSTYVFSIIFNHYTCTPREARLKIEKFLVALAEL